MFSLFLFMLLFHSGITSDSQSRDLDMDLELLRMARNFGLSIFNKAPFSIIRDVLFLEPEFYMKVPELIKHYGYPSEDHEVTTKDGYILHLHRIPYGTQYRQHTSNGLPILLIHSTFGSSANWVINFPNQSLGFLLADAGFDVWLANIRGNEYSRGHISLNNKSKEYWNRTTFDDMAEYDVPAMVDHILEKTGYNSLYYIGHSLGGSLPFAATTFNKDLNEKIKAIFSLAPFSNMVKTSFALRLLARLGPILEFIVEDIFHIYTLYVNFQTPLFGHFARLSFQPMKILLYTAFGFSKAEINKSRTEIYISHLWAGIPNHLGLQELQVIRNQKFEHYDWCTHLYKKVCNQEPQEYQLDGIEIPTYLFYGGRDICVTLESGQYFKDNLPYANGFYVSAEEFNHLDYILAANGKQLFFDDLIAGIKGFEQKNDRRANLDEYFQKHLIK